VIDAGYENCLGEDIEFVGSIFATPFLGWPGVSGPGGYSPNRL
jgi:hypothetical protein